MLRKAEGSEGRRRALPGVNAGFWDSHLTSTEATRPDSSSLTPSTGAFSYFPLKKAEFELGF